MRGQISGLSLYVLIDVCIRIMNAKELLKRYKKGEREFSGVNLKGANLSGVHPRFDVDAYDEPYRQGITSDLSGINWAWC